MRESLPQVIGHIKEGLQMVLDEARLRRQMRGGPSSSTSVSGRSSLVEELPTEADVGRGSGRAMTTSDSQGGSCGLKAVWDRTSEPPQRDRGSRFRIMQMFRS